MKGLLAAATAALVAAPLCPASAAIFSVGNSLAVRCYQSSRTNFISRDALRECDRALSEEPLVLDDRVATHVNRGIVRLHLGNFDGAEHDFDKALALDPNEPEALLNKGLSRLRKGDGANALPLIERAITSRTVRPALALYARGIAHEQTGNLRSAYADLIRARDLDPAWPIPREELKRYRVGRN